MVIYKNNEEEMYYKGINALNNGTIQERRNIIDEMNNSLNMLELAHQFTSEYQGIIGHTDTRKGSLYELSNEDVYNNLKSRVNVLHRRIQSDYKCKINQQAFIDISSERFNKNNRNNNIVDNFTIGNFLDIIKYVVSISELLSNKTNNLGKCITAIKVMNRVFIEGNKDVLKLKDVSLFVEVLTEAKNHFESDENARKQWTITSTTFSLCIDYLTKESR